MITNNITLLSRLTLVSPLGFGLQFLWRRFEEQLGMFLSNGRPLAQAFLHKVLIDSWNLSRHTESQGDKTDST